MAAKKSQSIRSGSKVGQSGKSWRALVKYWGLVKRVCAVMPVPTMSMVSQMGLMM